jgi:CDGSH-type Zn-finger protein/uncharacterized Fe-S cluster protein YjdI
MNAEPEIIAHSREQLIALLTEAAEIEHGLMCCYLYAAFSLKTAEDSGLTPDQLAATRRWREIVVDVAIEEMMHLGLVANLMTAIGATPHFQRPNFPVSAGFHPSGVVVELARFCKATVNHFVYLERPEGVELPDGESFHAPRAYVRATRADVLVPSAQDFLTVGHLYRAISGGMEKLASQLGENGLFIGVPSAQLSPAISGFDKLIRVTDLASARAAVEAIVEQGEGAPGHTQDSHFAKFCGVRDELAALAKADPNFDPAWPAARNPVMRLPPSPEGKVHVTAPEATALLDIGNAAYGLMLRCLMGAFGQPDASDKDRSLLYGAAIDLMHAVVPLAERLARSPATDAATLTAGLTFTLPRSITAIASPPVALRIIAERAAELAQACAVHGKDNETARNAAPGFAAIAASLGAVAGKPPAASPTAVATGDAAIAAQAPVSPAPNTPPIEEAAGGAITIRFEAKRCIHSRFCVLEAPSVFKANTPGKWLYPDTMDAERLVAVAEKCPSGAITYERHDGRPNEAAPPVNVARIRENGPYAINAEIDLAGSGMMRATLCRCGASKNKPFCDGSHNAIAFAASGEPATRKSEPLAARNGKLTINPQPNGPLSVSGPLEICTGTGRTVDRLASARLCRCGASNNKPFCDGTHAKIGFRSDV